MTKNRRCGSTHKFLCLAAVLNLDRRLASTVNDSERELLHVRLNLQVSEPVIKNSPHIEDSVPQVHYDLVLCSVTNETLVLGECNIGRCCAAGLVRLVQARCSQH